MSDGDAGLAGTRWGGRAGVGQSAGLLVAGRAVRLSLGDDGSRMFTLG